MPLEIEIAIRARRDLAEIWEYGADRFGLTQADRYGARLAGTIDRLGDNPRLGRPAPELDDGIRQVIVGQHRILYRENGIRVRVLRVLHGAADAPNQTLPGD